MIPITVAMMLPEVDLAVLEKATKELEAINYHLASK
jgi:hypothetical protein